MSPTVTIGQEPAEALAAADAGDTEGARAQGRTRAEVWRAARLPIALGVLITVAAAVIALVARQPEGALDPRGVDPSGSRALAVLLADRGVQVHRTDGVTAAVQAASANDTVLVPFPDLVPVSALRRLAGRPDGPGLMLIDPPSSVLRTVAPGARRSGRATVRVRQPRCRVHAARIAGDAQIGGTTYSGGTACYDGALALTRTAGGAQAVLLGSGDILTNRRLDHRGNAALALGLLGGGQVYWVMPGAAGGQLADRQGLIDLLPPWVVPAAVQLAVAGLLLALWRGRRLGPVVAEPLPVAVRAAEAVEGRARLYRRGHARDRAADTLRAAAQARLVDALGLGGDPPADALVTAVGARTGRPAEQVRNLLYGPMPQDDSVLVRLADRLDELVRTTLAERARVKEESSGDR